MENRREEIAKMLIRFYNMQNGTARRLGADSSTAINAALDRANDDVVAIKNHIREWSKSEDKTDSITDCFNAFVGTPKQEAPVADTTPAPVAQPTEQAVTNSLGILEQAVASIIAKTQAEKIEAEIMGSVEAKVQAFIKEEYGSIERKITTVVDGKPKEMKGIQHEKFETVLKFVANNEPVFLTGAAGTGKNVLCKQVADALGLKFYFTNAVTQEYKLTGFTDAMGNYQPTQFYEAFTKGGVFMLDEMDASIPEVLVILNAAIANRYFDFPAPIGYVEAHPDFRVIAAGNTTGHGADFEYVGRNQLDAASLDRFAVVRIGYSNAIEDSVAGDLELANFCREYRKACDEAGLSVIVSYRAIGRLAKMMQVLDLEEALETCLVKGLDKDDLNIIIEKLSEGKYKDALKKVARAL